MRHCHRGEEPIGEVIQVNIIESMHDSALFRKWFGPTWRNWETFLKALFNLPMDEDDAIVYQGHTKRETAPMTPFKQAWVVVGRRGGKSLIAALVAVYLAVFRDYRQHLKHGEIGMISIIAADRRQARIILRYVKSFLGFPAMVKGLIANETADSVELSNNDRSADGFLQDDARIHFSGGDRRRGQFLA
jgi:hypothetical protein